MSDELGGRTAVISGATSGIGAMTARRLAHAGARVVALGRRTERLLQLCDELGAASCHVVAVDVADRAAVGAALQALPPAFATVDILVNNAGVALGSDRAPDADPAKWQQMVDTNIGGVLTLTQLLLPGMVARDRGDIVNIGSAAGNWPYPAGNVYGATKAFVHQFTLNLRADLLGKNIRATCIEPGTVRTEFAAVRTGSAASGDAFYDHANLMYPEDVAEIVFFCLCLPRRVNINVVEAMPLGQGFPFPAFAEGMTELDPPPPRLDRTKVRA